MIHPDFSHCHSLQEVIDKFVAKNKEWRYLIYDDRSFGYAVIEKKLS
jgi:hypothetical protein